MRTGIAGKNQPNFRNEKEAVSQIGFNLAHSFVFDVAFFLQALEKQLGYFDYIIKSKTNAVQTSRPIDNSEILNFFLYGIQPSEKHISDSRISKPLRIDLCDLIQPYGAGSFDGRLALGELPAARLAAGSVDRVIGQEGLVEVHQGIELFQPVCVIAD